MASTNSRAFLQETAASRLPCDQQHPEPQLSAPANPQPAMLVCEIHEARKAPNPLVLDISPNRHARILRCMVFGINALRASSKSKQSGFLQVVVVGCEIMDGAASNSALLAGSCPRRTLGPRSRMITEASLNPKPQTLNLKTFSASCQR